MRLGIIADIHEDILRLEEAMKILKKENVDEYIFLGDMVGFGAPYYSYLKTRNSNKVIDILKENFDIVIKGNHDLFDIKMLPDNRDLIDLPENYYSLNYFKRKELANGRLQSYDESQLNPLLSEDNEKYVSLLPEYIFRDYGDSRILFSHYNYPDVTGSLVRKIMDSKELSEHFNFMKENNCLYSFSGHDHFEGIKLFTENEAIILQFNEKYTLPNEIVWLNGPTIANGTFKNGFMIYDTETREIVAIPLNTIPHIKFGGFEK